MVITYVFASIQALIILIDSSKKWAPLWSQNELTLSVNVDIN